jgi:hypothetical protein
MSGYFGALIRSSGIAIGASTTTAAEPGVAAVRVEGASSAQPGLETPAADHDASATPGSPAMSPSSVIRAPAAAAPLVGPVGRASAGAAEPPSPTTGVVRSSEAPQPDPPPGDSRVRAALRWIAADTLQKRTPARGAASTTTTASLDRVAEANPTPPGARLASPAQPVVGERQSVQAVAAALLHARDEVTEISIGAIHLRVDAPAAQTVARAAAPNPATSRAPASSARSSLARRALRRI